MTATTRARSPRGDRDLGARHDRHRRPVCALASGEVAVLGHSQGGHAALFAAEIATSYAPDLDVVGSVALAPATEIPLLATDIRRTPFFGFALMAVAGFNAAHPDARLEQVLTAEAMALVPKVDEECAFGVIGGLFGRPAERLIAREPGDVEPRRSLIRENNPGERTPTVPVLIAHGGRDQLLPVRLSEQFAERVRDKGASVELRTYPDADHVSIVGASKPDVLAWIDQRLADG